MNRNGFTLAELLIAIIGLGVIAGVITLICVAVHFIAKVW
jgi:Tfp pilus assembly protein PilE